jgi:hypothetical protein
VVDKVKALILFHLVGGVFGVKSDRAREIVEMVKAEESRPDGATILGDGARVTRHGATLANCEILHVSGLIDSFRMITHPGPVLIAVALVNAELGNKTVRDMITALAAGYEFACRLADDFVPSIAAHGFRPAPIFSTMGAALVAGKLMDLDEDGLVAAIAVAANSASGLNEAGRTGGGEIALHEPNAARQGVFAALIAKTSPIKGSERVIEGDAGFYNAYAGSRNGVLSYVFSGPRHINLASITDELGLRYKLLGVMFRLYSTAGFNQPVIELMTELRQQHEISPDDIEEVVVFVNYLETLYPSPEFPRATPSLEDIGNSVGQNTPTQYFASYVAVNGTFPVIGGVTAQQAGDYQQLVLDFMVNRVRLVPVHDQPMFSPKISVKLKNGMTHQGNYPYARMEWDFGQLIKRLDDCTPGLPGGRHRLRTLIETMQKAETLASVGPLIRATGTPWRVSSLRKFINGG